MPKELAREYWSNRPMELAAALFAAGTSPIELCLGRTSIRLPYGADGSLVVMTAWVFYASMIVFFGAELTAQRGELPAATDTAGDGARAGGDPVRPRSAVHRELARAGPACVDVSALSLALPPA
jgi:hypothetical protein